MCFSYSFSFPRANPVLAAGFGVESDENDLESPVNEEDMATRSSAGQVGGRCAICLENVVSRYSSARRLENNHKKEKDSENIALLVLQKYIDV